MVSIKEEYLEKFSEHKEYPSSELAETADNLHSAIQNQFNDHFKWCFLRSGRNYWLLEEKTGVWLAMNKFEIAQQMRDSDIEYDKEKLISVAYAYLEQFQDKGLTIKVPGAVARKLEDPFFHPIFVPYPDDWDKSEYNKLQRFQMLVWRYEMTPAEALDYWATRRMNQSAAEWAGKRNVQTEAVRKNVRQAEDKLGDDELGATHEKNLIQAVSVDEVPNGKPHNEEEDVFYVPTDESLGDWDPETE